MRLVLIFCFDAVLERNLLKTVANRDKAVEQLGELKAYYEDASRALSGIFADVQPSPDEEPDVGQIDFLEKCRRLKRWLRFYIQDTMSFGATHVLAKLRLVLPSFNFNKLLNWPADMDPLEADKLCEEETNLAGTILRGVVIWPDDEDAAAAPVDPTSAVIPGAGAS